MTGRLNNKSLAPGASGITTTFDIENTSRGHTQKKAVKKNSQYSLSRSLDAWNIK